MKEEISVYFRIAFHGRALRSRTQAPLGWVTEDAGIVGGERGQEMFSHKIVVPGRILAKDGMTFWRSTEDE